MGSTAHVLLAMWVASVKLTWMIVKFDNLASIKELASTSLMITSVYVHRMNTQ